MKKTVIKALIFSFFLIFMYTGLGHAKMVMVTEKKANIRNGPDTKYDLIWSAPQYTPFEALCQYKKWYVIRDYEGDIGWVYGTLVKEVKAVIIKVKKTVIRSGPGESFDVLWEVQEGYPFKVLEEKGEWVKVIDAEGDSGWISKKSTWGLGVE